MDSKITALLETITSESYERSEGEWKEALRLFHLNVSYIPALQVILKQGRWCRQPNPIAYIRKAARWRAIRMGLIDMPCQTGPEVLVADLNYTDSDGRAVPHDEKIDMALAGYEANFGSYYDDYDDDPYYEVSEALLGDGELVNWERAAELAGLDAGERIVLDIQLMGVGRDQALALCYSDEDRKFLQAAWKRFVRHKLALRATLRSGGSHQSRRIRRVTAEKERELVFVELAGGGLKISFREPVPESPI
jgi:hypothetical protein